MKRYPNLEQWRKRVLDLGHGNQHEMTAQEAIAIAKSATTTCNTEVDSNDPQFFEPGQSVAIVADIDGGENPVVGQLRALSTSSVVVSRTSDDAGDVCVHFPRIGYRISPASS